MLRMRKGEPKRRLTLCDPSHLLLKISTISNVVDIDRAQQKIVDDLNIAQPINQSVTV